MNAISAAVLLCLGHSALPHLPSFADGHLSYRGRSVPVAEAADGISYEQFQLFHGGKKMWLRTKKGVRLYSLPELKLIAFHVGARDAFVRGGLLGIALNQDDRSLIRWNNQAFRSKRVDHIDDVSSDGTLISGTIGGKSKVAEVGTDFQVVRAWSNTPGRVVEGPIERLSRNELVTSSMGPLAYYFEKLRLNSNDTMTLEQFPGKRRLLVPEGVWLPSWVDGELICFLSTNPGNALPTAPHFVARYANGNWQFTEKADLGKLVRSQEMKSK